MNKKKMIANLNLIHSITLPPPPAGPVPTNGRFIVTPEIARQWLEVFNYRNRSIKKTNLKYLCGVFRRGEWKFNGEPIVFARTGRLLNGQHRLMACVQTGISFETNVETTIEEEAFTTYDPPTSVRPNAQILEIRGEVNTYMLAASLAWAWRLEKKNLQLKDIPSASEIDQLVERHPGMRDSVYRTKTKFFRQGGGSSVASFVHYIAQQQNVEKCEQFFYMLETGIGLEKGNAVLPLRARLLDQLGAKARLLPAEVLALYIKAWTAFRDDRKVTALRWRTTGETPEPFPSL